MFAVCFKSNGRNSNLLKPTALPKYATFYNL